MADVVLKVRVQPGTSQREITRLQKEFGTTQRTSNQAAQGVSRAGQAAGTDERDSRACQGSVWK